MSTTIAVVTGASRGAGRAIALELGAAGATVYVTGRSIEGGPTTPGFPGSRAMTPRAVIKSAIWTSSYRRCPPIAGCTLGSPIVRESVLGVNSY